MAEKKCSNCGPKSVDQFYRKSAAKDGLQAYCKICDRRRVKEHREANPEKYRADNRKHYAANLEKCRENHRKYRATHKKERYALVQAARARKRGELVPGPCEECSSTENIHGHHEDYSKPLEVRWLCRSCHQRLHAEQKKDIA